MRILAAFLALVGGSAGLGWLMAGAPGAVMAGVSALLASLGFCRGADRWVLRLAGAVQVGRDVAPDLYRLVERLAARAGAPGPAPRLYWLPGAAPNALATGRDLAHASIAMTPDLPMLLERDELEGLLARELAGLDRKGAWCGDVAAAVAGGLMLLARRPAPGEWTDRSAGHDAESAGAMAAGRPAIGAVMRRAVAWIAAGVARAGSSAARVYDVDAAGARMLSDPLPLARALVKLTAANSRRPACDVNPGLAHQFVVTPTMDDALRPLFSAPTPASARLLRLTLQALQPAANAG